MNSRYIVVCVFALALAGCGRAGEQERVTEMPAVAPQGGVQSVGSQGQGQVTLNLATDSEIPTLDPQIAGDELSIAGVENLFIQLTNFAPQSDEILPEAATDWTVSEDGTEFVFTIRTDIPWVKYIPETGEVKQERTPEGDPRFVTAQDFAYGIRRACDPRIGSGYSWVVAPVLKGCEQALMYEDLTEGQTIDELLGQVGVSAESEDRLVIDLAFPASYFLSMTPLWTLSATPAWAIDEHGEGWIEPENIVTTGRYALESWDRGVQFRMIRNPVMPADLRGQGNIDLVELTNVPDRLTAYQLWLTGKVDRSGIPGAELKAHLDAFPDETLRLPDLGTYFVGFRSTKPPVDDPRVRRALSAAIDREALVNNVAQGQGFPMIHFAPPGVFGAPPKDQVGVGFDPEHARQELAAAGYPGCNGLPTLFIVGFPGPDAMAFLEFAQAQWKEHLGCSSEQLRVEQLPFADLLAATDVDVPDEEAPHMYTMGWGADFPDEENFVGSVLFCRNSGRLMRQCSEVDDLIVEAREEPDRSRRQSLYLQIEEMFFGPEGEMPIAPIYSSFNYSAEHSWVKPVEVLFGGPRYYQWTVNWAAKLAAQGD